VIACPRSGSQPRHLSLLSAVLSVAAVLVTPLVAEATTIQRIVSPGGIEAWLVQEPSVPLIALDFAFRGGANQDPVDKPGVATMATSLLDEGAGELDSKSFHERVEAKAIQLGFSANRDQASGSLRTLSANQDEAFELLRLAVTSAHFDAADIERIRDQMLSGLRRETTSPNEMASRRWWSTAFPGHPYGRPVRGSLESIPTITAADLKDYMRRVFARDTLKIAIVGDIDAAAAGKLIDKAFGDLPAKSNLVAVPVVTPQGLGQKIAIDLDVPQSVLMLGGVGIPRNDPDFMAAFVVNHVLGGGSFSSRLYREVREVRGLAYSVFSTLIPLDHASLFMTGTATRADRAVQTLEVLESEIHRLAESGPTEDELTKAKSFLTGSYALAFDTSGKIAAQLVRIQLDNLGIDYINKRNDLIDAVTPADAQRVARHMLDGKMLVTVVGRPQGVTSQEASGPPGSGG
jgi:zinc protease